MSFIKDPDLFRANNHSKFKIGWKQISPDVKTEIAKLLSEYYGASNIIEIKQVDEWEKMSNNYLIVSKHGGSITRNLLRRHILITDSKKLEFMEKISMYLVSEGIPTPYVIPAVNGNNHLFSKGHMWQLFEFIPGNHFRGTSVELKDIAKNIALIHKAFYKIPFEVELLEKEMRSSKGWKNLFELAKKDKTELGKLVAGYSGYLSDMVDKIDSIYQPEVRNMQAVHGDLHPQNTIYRNGRIAAILDFADMGLSERMRDVGNACHRFVRQFVVYQDKAWQKEFPRGMGLFLKNYSELYPITREELKLIPALMLDDILRKIYIGITDYCINGDPKYIENGELQKKMKLVREAEILGNMISMF